MSPIAAIILAAGASRRLGQPKQLVRHANGTLLRNAIVAAQTAGCDLIVVVSGAVDLSPVTVAEDGAVLVSNPNWSAGMGGSISIGISSALVKHPTLRRALVLLCDQPKLGGAVLQDLCEQWERSGRPMAACRYGGSIGPPCGFDQSCFPALAGLPADRGAKALLKPVEAVAVWDWPDGAIDIDTPEDLTRWRQS